MSKSKEEKMACKARVEKKRNKKGRKEEKLSGSITRKDKTPVPVFSLLADEKTTNPALSSLFSAKVRVQPLSDTRMHTYPP